MIRRTILVTHTLLQLLLPKIKDPTSSTVVLSHTGHDHLRKSAFSLEQIALFVRGRSKRLGHLRFS